MRKGPESVYDKWNISVTISTKVNMSIICLIIYTFRAIYFLCWILSDDNLGLMTKYYVLPIIIYSPSSLLQVPSQAFLSFYFINFHAFSYYMFLNLIIVLATFNSSFAHMIIANNRLTFKTFPWIGWGITWCSSSSSQVVVSVTV